MHCLIPFIIHTDFSRRPGHTSDDVDWSTPPTKGGNLAIDCGTPLDLPVAQTTQCVTLGKEAPDIIELIWNILMLVPWTRTTARKMKTNGLEMMRT